MNRDTFAGYHPVVNFLYFLAVLGLSMFIMHPVCLGISLVCAVAYSGYLKGAKAMLFQLRFMLPLLLLTALLNPVFNHEGATILLYIGDGNPLTLEAIYYGIAAASMMVAVITWFSCCNVVMTSDKFVYLFGKLIPALSLILSMTLRFVPRFTAQIKVVTQAQRCVGRDVSSGSVRKRIHNGLTILSIVITWALENAIETADSMRSRGYGMAGRTAFSIYRLQRRDFIALAAIVLLVAYVIVGYATDGIYWQYYPLVSGELTGAYSISIFAAYLGLCLLPLLINFGEDLKWKSLTSKI